MLDTQTHEARLLLECGNLLAEGIQWNVDHQRLYWTDIFGNALWSCDAEGQAVEKVELEAGLAAFAFTDRGRMIAGFVDGLCWLDPQTGAREMIAPYQPENPDTRMNDGGLDRQGRFIVGGMDEAGKKPITPVWSVTPGGITELFGGVGCANSTAFSPDGTVMYFADTAGTKIFARDYDPDTGRAGEARVFHDTDLGFPDGSAVDSEGTLWNARWEGAAIIGLTSCSTKSVRIDLPVAHVTCCAFGGPDLRRLFITTANITLSDEEKRARPEAGGIFYVDLPVPGLPGGYYRESLP